MASSAARTRWLGERVTAILSWVEGARSGYDEWKPDGATWDEATDLFELQTGPHLTTGELHRLLARVDPALPVTVAVDDGMSCESGFVPVEVSYTGAGDRPDALVVTVARLEHERPARGG